MSIPLNPLRYLRFVVKVYRGWARVRGRTNLSLGRQLIENYRLLRLNLMEPEEYYQRLELFNPQLTWEEKTRFLSRNQLALLMSAFNPRGAVGVFSKYVFHVYARHFDLPVAEFYGLFHPHLGFTADGADLRTRDDLSAFFARPEISECMLKPIDGWKGRGSMLARKNADGTLHLVGEGDASVADIFDRMSHTHHNASKQVIDAWIIEQRVRQHPFFDRYADSCTHTIRIVTFVTKSGRVDEVATVMKIAMPGRHIDNLGDTGATARVYRGGVMGPAIREEPGGLAYYDRHPETDAPIKGEVIPLYQEAMDLAFHAQAALPQLRTAGWDIAITENGPVIIEGNSYWGWYMMQRGTNQGILTGDFGAEVRELTSQSARM